MAYTPTSWSDGETPAVSAANLNKIEQGLAAAASSADTALSAASSASTTAATAVSTANTASTTATDAVNSLTAMQGLPTYCQGTGLAGRFDPARSVYNWKASNTRRLRAGMAKAAAGGEADLIVIGDSITAGCNNVSGVYDRPHAWPMMMGATLADLGVPVAGTGVVRPWDSTVYDARMSFTGSFTNNGTDITCIGGSGSTATLTTNKAGTTASVYYYDDPSAGPFTISVNGASSGPGFLTVAGGAAHGPYRADLTGLSGVTAGSTVKVTVTSANIVVITGMEVSTPNAGLSIHNVAQSGSRASGTGDVSWSDATNENYPLQVFGNMAYRTTPCAAFICLGTNDLYDGASVAACIAGLTTVAGKFSPNMDVVLIAAPQPNAVALGNWTPLVAAMYQLADTLNVPLFDIHDRFGGYAIEAANGFAGDTLAHLTTAAYADWGRSAGLAVAS